MATAPRLEKICADGDGDLALVMSGVRFIDSSGLRALFEIEKASSKLVLVRPSAVVKRLLSLTEMTDVFEMSDDLSDLDS
jgi:anti-anti-sigma factor